MIRIVDEARPITQPLVPSIIMEFPDTLLRGEPALMSSLR